MILAELYGKIPSKLEDKEDILTSNVFSFFKYSDRKLLKDYLQKLGINVNLEDCKKAEFQFWLSYEDGTEPDLIIICGKYYLLFEAKLYSDFSPKTDKIDSQIEREISMGKMSAKNLNKEFVYIALTAEYYKNKSKFLKYENGQNLFIWTNWQAIASFINDKLENGDLEENKEFALDLFALLVKKRLRSFIGLLNVTTPDKIKEISSIFYNVQTSKFKGEFSGFIDSSDEFERILPYQKFYTKSFFVSLSKFENNNKSTIFYNVNQS